MKLLVVSSFPEKDLLHGKKTVGVASYAKNTLLHMLKDVDADITVFAETLEGEDFEYQDSGMHVVRNWKRGSFLSLISLYSKIVQHPSKKVMLQFEMYMFGNAGHALLSTVLTTIARLMGKEITLVLHQVVSNVEIFEKNKVKQLFFNLTKSIFYKMVLLSASKVVVFEQELKNRLGGASKIYVIPHAVEQDSPIEQNDAKRYLGLDINKKYVLYFGFLSPYKGVDTLINSWNLGEEYQLIVAGGPNPNYKDDEEYNAFVKEVFDTAATKNIMAPGFLPQEDIKYYFSAADLVVLPYVLFMSSSGPMAFGFTYDCGILMSEPLSVYFETHDMKAALNEVGLSKDDITFSLDETLNDTVVTAYANLPAYKEFSALVKTSRSWKVIGEQYNTLISNDE